MTDDERAEVEAVRAKYPKWRDPQGAHNQCNIASDALIGRIPGAERIWVHDGTAHCMALLPSGAIVDLTAVQFGTPDEYANTDALLKHWTRYKVALVEYDVGTTWTPRPGVEPPPEVEPPPLPELKPRFKRPSIRPLDE